MLCVFLSKGGLVKDDAKEFVGAATKVKVAKNKLAPPFRECMFDMMFGQGICKRGELLDLGVATGLLARQGAWYAFTEDGAAALGPAAAAPADGGDDAATTDATDEAISAAAKKKKKGAAKKKGTAAVGPATKDEEEGFLKGHAEEVAVVVEPPSVQ